MPYVLATDDAFPLKPYVMKLYNFRDQNKQERIFSCLLSRARRTVESAFSIVTNRFRVLSTPIQLDPTKAEKVVLACFVLFNMLRIHDIHEGTGLGSICYDNNVAWRQTQLLDLSRDRGRNASNDAKQVREEYSKYFNQGGAVTWQKYVYTSITFIIPPAYDTG